MLPPASTATERAQSKTKRAGEVPLTAWRQSSAPVAPLNLITVKIPLKLFGLGRLQRKPTATTFPSVSTVTALAESLHSPWKTEPVVTWRQSSAPVAPLYLTTVKSPRLPRLLPAATTFPARS